MYTVTYREILTKLVNTSYNAFILTKFSGQLKGGLGALSGYPELG